MSGILWLASYPKSGNTWLRAFVANLQNDTEGPADINQLGTPLASNRRFFDDAAGVEASDLTEEEIARCRPLVYRSIANSTERTVFLKIHEAFTMLPDGAPLIPPDATAGAVYVVRNPLDVAISFAHHAGQTVDRTIAVMATKDFSFAADIPARNLNQRLLSWSGHVLSWIDQSFFPVHVVRYEDMHGETIETFTGVARFCGLPCDPASVQKALRHSSFEQLQRQERERGFVEKPATASAFFREGRVNTWKAVLSESQIALIVGQHGTVMRRLNYLR